MGPTPTATPPNLLLYLAGHGGDGFLKFGDVGEVSSEDLLSTLGEMKIKRLFNKALIIVDTCQAGTISNAWGDRKGEHARQWKEGGGGSFPYEIFPSYEHVSDLLGEDVFFIGR